MADAQCCTIAGKEVPAYIIGDSAYPVNTWLMKPFTDNLTLPVARLLVDLKLRGLLLSVDCSHNIWSEIVVRAFTRTVCLFQYQRHSLAIRLYAHCQ